MIRSNNCSSWGKEDTILTKVQQLFEETTGQMEKVQVFRLSFFIFVYFLIIINSDAYLTVIC